MLNQKIVLLFYVNIRLTNLETVLEMSELLCTSNTLPMIFYLLLILMVSERVLKDLP